MKSIFTALTLTLLLAGSILPDAQAQNRQQLLNKELEAKSYFDNLVFEEALKRYLELDSLKPNTPDYEYKIGICYIHTYNHNKALPYLEKCAQTPDKFPMALEYYLGRAYHLSNRFDEAIVHYGRYRDFFVMKKAKHNQTLVRDVDDEIRRCENGKLLVAKPIDVTIYNLGPAVNSVYPEYAPVLNAEGDELIFTSNRPNTTGGKIDHSVDGEYYEDLYISYYKNNAWTAPVPLSDSINTESHDASIFLSADGKNLLIYRNSKENMLASADGDLYLSTMREGKWNSAVKLNENINGKSWEPSACISPDGKMLIFTSNREGGVGGSDLYVSYADTDGKWGPALNLGTTINSYQDEDAPFIHPDGKTLFFSSKGHNGMGGYDVFRSEWDESTQKWTEPVNVGYPISTASDDLHFSWSADGKRVYFSTIREDGQGDQDLYYAEFKEAIKEEKIALVVISLKDSVSATPLKALLVISKMDDNGDVISSTEEEVTAELGSASFPLKEGSLYRIKILAEGYPTKFVDINLKSDEHFEEIRRDILLSK